jgi:hypothetical protein
MQIIFTFVFAKIVLRVSIAKILSLFTVLLLGSNIVLSSVPKNTLKFSKAVSDDDRYLKIQSGVNELGSTFLEVNFENDAFEDLEFISDVPPDEVSLVFTFLNELDPVAIKNGRYYSSGVKVPRWLWVRHILI